MSFMTFGEIMLRLTPGRHLDTLPQSQTLNMDFAGAESNVASSLALLGHHCHMVTKIPNNPVGEAAVTSLRRFGIDTRHIQRGGERLGTYFIELGTSIRPSRVTYDRAYSALAQMAPEEFDWNTVLKGQQWLHLSGITPAISPQCAEATVEAARTAKAMGLSVSFDLNFRRTLWERPEKARDYFERILEHTDLALGNAGVMADVFDEHYTGDALAVATGAATSLRERFGVDAATTARNHHDANHNTVAGVLVSDAGQHQSQQISVGILDRLGTGDAFAAGVIHGYLNRWPEPACIEFAAAAFALAHTIAGDQHWCSEAEIQHIANGHHSGHIIR
ncbi:MULTISPECIES: sugar kinase [Marinimicrobium]|uniref:sugar kinase n=1 Tax=Marinimicrobium TaxID=359337 RepID=UPI00041AF3E9|nr:sugar kinase [Marinimicrobium agarilyticum]